MTGHAKIDEVTDMASIADELMALARTIHAGRQIDQHLDLESSATPIPGDHSLAPRKLLAMAEQTYADRRKRDHIIGQSELFGEPAWDILLDLFVAHLKDRDVSVSSACIGSAAPPTTGLRWLGVLEENGLVVREKDLQDQRRILVRISDDGMRRMSEYFHSLPQPPKQPLPA